MTLITAKSPVETVLDCVIPSGAKEKAVVVCGFFKACTVGSKQQCWHKDRLAGCWTDNPFAEGARVAREPNSCH